MKYQKALLLTRWASELPQAKRLVSEAIEARDLPQYRLLRGFIALELKAYDEAVRDFESVAETQRITTGHLDLALAEACLGAGQLESAQNYYDSAVQKASNAYPLDPNRLTRVEKQLEQARSQS